MNAPERVALLVSPRLPARFRHGFATRAGGVSGGPFASLNLGHSWGDDVASVNENRRRVVQALGAERLYLATQVHGNAVHVVRREDSVEGTAGVRADAVCTDVPGYLVGVLVADCVPLLLGDARTGACAAVHAGWRGTVAGVVRAAVEALVTMFGVVASDLHAVLGPSIGPCCFEVGDEVVAAFESAWPGEARRWIARPSGKKAHVDLWAANRRILELAGVQRERIDGLDLCTACDRARFYSFRRDGRPTGQHLGAIVAG